MRRARISPFLLAMTAAVSLASGVGITLVLEDAYNVPYNKIQFDAKNLENLDWEQLLDFLEEHPELVEYVMENWADRIAEMFQNGDFSDIDLESLLELAQNHPEILQGIAEQLAEQILNSGMTLGGLSSEELADLVKNNPELATALLEYLQQNGGDLSSMTTDDLLEFASQHPEVAAGILAALTGDIVSEIDSIKSNRDALDGDEPQPSEDFDAIDAEWEEQGITAGSGGSGAGGGSGGGGADDGSGGGSAGTPGGDSPLGSSLDRGDLDPNREGKTLFYFTTNYSGTVYIRNQSYGDYNYLIGDFNEPSGYDGELYMVSPVFYTTLAGMNRSSSYDIQFHLGSFRSRSMLSASYSDVSYLDQNNEKQVFSTLEEARVRNRDISEYSSKFYPEMETNYLALPSYLNDEESRYYSYVKRTYLSVPEDLKPALTSFISNHSISKNPYVIEEFFRRKGTYAGMVFNGGTQGIDDPIERFLESSLTGTCSNFASAMTMICRQLGLPARLTNGYLVSASGDKNNVVADTNGHAWVEVYESGKGWIRFDPTPSKGEPAMTEPTILNGDASKPLPSSSQPKNLFQYSNSNGMSDALYFRSTAFGDYDPDTWTFEEKPAIGEESNSSLFTFANNVESRTNPSFGNVKITMMDGFQDYGAIVPEYARPSSVTSIGLSPYDDVRLTRTSQVSYRLDYLSEFEIPSGTTQDWEYRNSILPKYQVLVDGDLKNQLIHYAETYGIPLSGMNYFATAEAIQKHLDERYVMDADYVPSGTMDPVLELFANQKGNAKMFAAAHVLLCRALGVPARLVGGYQSPHKKEFTITEKHATYWSEVYSLGIGWRSLHFTGFDPAITSIVIKRVSSSSEFNGLPVKPTLENYQIEINGNDKWITPDTYASDLSGNRMKISARGDYVEFGFFDSMEEKLFHSPSDSYVIPLTISKIRVFDPNGNSRMGEVVYDTPGGGSVTLADVITKKPYDDPKSPAAITQTEKDLGIFYTNSLTTAVGDSLSSEERGETTLVQDLRRRLGPNFDDFDITIHWSDVPWDTKGPHKNHFSFELTKDGVKYSGMVKYDVEAGDITVK